MKAMENPPEMSNGRLLLDSASIVADTVNAILGRITLISINTLG